MLLLLLRLLFLFVINRNINLIQCYNNVFNLIYFFRVSLLCGWSVIFIRLTSLLFISRVTKSAHSNKIVMQAILALLVHTLATCEMRCLTIL